MLSLNKSYKKRKVSLTIHCKYKYFDSTVQRAEDRRQKFYFCRFPFAVNVKLNLSSFSFPRNSKLENWWGEGSAKQALERVCDRDRDAASPK